jgi:hypothetical protein
VDCIGPQGLTTSITGLGGYSLVCNLGLLDPQTFFEGPHAVPGNFELRVLRIF